MGILAIATFMTLDGVTQAPGGPDEDSDGVFEHGGWSFPYFSEDMGDLISDAFGKAECVLLGRRTYEIFAASWPNFPNNDDPVASQLNTLPKYVVSTTLEHADWQPTTIIHGDIPAQVAKLKEQYQGEIQVHGSAALAQTLHAHNLIDEYRLFIEPVVLGTGKRLFEPGAAPTALQLVESKAMGKGSVLAIYQPTGKPTYGEFQMEEVLSSGVRCRGGRRYRPLPANRHRLTTWWKSSISHNIGRTMPIASTGGSGQPISSARRLRHDARPTRMTSWSACCWSWAITTAGFLAPSTRDEGAELNVPATRPSGAVERDSIGRLTVPGRHDRDVPARRPWRVIAGDGAALARAPDRGPLRLTIGLPVAVVQDPGTASSGEGVVTALRGRPGVRSFGRPTAGMPTGNELFTLSDLSAINLTVAVGVDHGGWLARESSCRGSSS